jgi:hypothetical protein
MAPLLALKNAFVTATFIIHYICNTFGPSLLMVGFFIDFQWFRDSKGYRIIPPRGFRGERIVRNGGDLIAYRPLDKIDVLYALLARVETTNDLLDFIGR